MLNNRVEEVAVQSCRFTTGPCAYHPKNKPLFFFFFRVLYNWVCLNASAFGCERLLLKQPCDILAACSHGVRKAIHMQRHKTANLL